MISLCSGMLSIRPLKIKIECWTKIKAQEMCFIPAQCQVPWVCSVSCDPDKVTCVKEWKVPECVTEVCSFLGFVSYYRRFIPEFAAIAIPLTRLT